MTATDGTAARRTLRSRLPAVVREVIDDPIALRTLVAACAALAAVGLDPHILDPGMPTIREALKAEPSLQGLFMLSAVVQSGFVLLGGVLADTFRSTRLVRLALWGLVAASALAVLIPQGPGLIAVRFIAWGCDGVVLPFAIGAVAMVYERTARATALGVAYAVLGAGTAVAPVLALALGAAGPRWPAFAACIAAALLAVRVSHGFPDLPGASRGHRGGIVAVALFAFGVVALLAGLVSVSDAFDPLRLLVLAAGVSALAASFVVRARRSGRGGIPIDLRPVAVALAAGVVIGFAQAAPMLHLPLYFALVDGVPPLVASLAIAPFVVALVVAGPVSGWLLARFSPRVLIAGGVLAVAAADLVVAAVIGRTTPYPAFVLSFVLIGAGFVVATSVRTAVIFASVPRALPASAAALNEASLGLGARLGITVATVVMARTAIAAYGAGFAGLPADAVESLVAPFREVVTVIGLPAVYRLVADLSDAARASYHDALIAGWRMSELVPGVVALIAGAVVFLAMGARDPIRSVWDLADERDQPDRGS